MQGVNKKEVPVIAGSRMEPHRSQSLLWCRTGPAESCTSNSSTPGSANLAKALTRYNTVKAVAEANQERLSKDGQENMPSQPQGPLCQTQPGEFTSAEVGVLGANVSQLRSAPDVWFSPRTKSYYTGRESMDQSGSARNGHRQDAMEPNPPTAPPDHQGQTSQEDHKGMYDIGRQAPTDTKSSPFGLILREGVWSSDTQAKEILHSARHQRALTEPQGRHSIQHEDAAALQARLARIELANETELQSSHLHTSHHTWPMPGVESTSAFSAGPPAPLTEDFSPLQSSTMEVQARNWPKSYAHHTSFIAHQHGSPQRSHLRSASWSAADRQEPFRGSTDSTEAMLAGDNR